MIPWLRSLLYDPVSFANAIRFLVFLGGETLTNTVPSSWAWYAGKGLQAMALLIKAGDRLPRASNGLPAPPRAIGDPRFVQGR